MESTQSHIAMWLATIVGLPTDSRYGFSIGAFNFLGIGMDLPVFNLERAFRQKGCAICRLKQESQARYLFSFLWENVNDGGIRAHLVAALGFCREHAWQLKETEQSQYGAGLGTGIVYEDLATRAWQGLRELRAQQNPLAPQHWSERVRAFFYRWRYPHRTRKYRMTFPDGLVSREECRVCQIVRETEETCLDFFVRGCADAEFRDLYRASDGLCLPHLRAVLEITANREIQIFLIDTAEEKLGTLVRQLREYLRKQIWDYRDEPKIPEEQSSWIRAIEFFVGKP